jgi:hypothetical protein
MEQLEVTLKTMKDAEGHGKAAGTARTAWLIDNFENLFKPFTETLTHYPAGHLSIVTGAGRGGAPISAIHPDAMAAAKNKLVAEVLDTLGAGKARIPGPGDFGLLGEGEGETEA